MAASGDAPLYYQWRFNGANLADATETSFYTVVNAKAGDAGPSPVVVTNALGAVTSSVANLGVRMPPLLRNNPPA